EHELPNAAAEQFQQYAKAEARKVWDLHQAGIIRELYFHAEKNEAVLILECESVLKAHDMLTTLPFVQAGLISFEVIPLIAYSGFERLFVKS
ncbi:MAG TPA: muconolactone Delta-isomerase family protein, partial [Anaerolineales bacterium]|nr:muconolactone Delta-isomerase family protein [Anaerolineales bacterium]